jgi:hypothetical protein
MTKTAPLSSWTVTVGWECLPLLLDRTVLPAGIVAGAGPAEVGAVWAGPWRVQRDAATAAWRRRALAGKLLAWASRLPDGLVSIAECIWGERFARRNAVTRFVRRSGGGGGICIVRDIVGFCGCEAKAGLGRREVLRRNRDEAEVQCGVRRGEWSLLSASYR